MTSITSNLKKGLSGNQLKLIAALFMTIDHIGFILFPDIIILRIIGRLAFPIFAFAISEGCRHTSNRRVYLMTLFTAAAAVQVIYTIATASLYMNIFVTLTLSVLSVIVFDKAILHERKTSLAIFLSYMGIIFALCEILPQFIPGFCIDYGFFGVLLPLWCYVDRNKKEQLLYFTIGLILLSASKGGIQYFSLLSVPLTALYNNTRGKAALKWFFYLYYPLHIALLYAISYIF